MQLPLTLAIIPALVVRASDQRFAIPHASLVELISIGGVEQIHGTPVYRLRGNLLPLVHLRDVLGLGPREEAFTGSIHVVVLQADQRKFGLVVDEVRETQEIVVKPLSRILKRLPEIAGSTIMGDGRVVLILDVLGIAQRAKILSEAGSEELALGLAEVEGSGAGERHRLLVVESVDHGRIAVPLDRVVRLEEFSREFLDHAGDQCVIQYRDGILPLYHILDFVEERRCQLRDDDNGAAVDPVPVIVYRLGERQVGVMVEGIVDIVEDGLEVTGPSTRRGVSATAVLAGRVTELFDTEAVYSRLEGA
jgi:two-component system chemotaxis sensor kinase CheA